jgi:hypothetical protein
MNVLIDEEYHDCGYMYERKKVIDIEKNNHIVILICHQCKHTVELKKDLL